MKPDPKAAAKARPEARCEAGGQAGQAEAARLQARSDRRSFEEGRGQEAAEAGGQSGAAESRRTNTPKFDANQVAAVARQARSAAPGGGRRNAQRHGQSRRGERRAGRAIVAERDRCVARAHQPVAGVRRRGSTPRAGSMSCLRVLFKPDGFLAQRSGRGRRFGVGVGSRACRERQARAAAVPAVHDAQARALRPVERP